MAAPLAPAIRRWGGARAGAGRPKRGAIASEPHKPRPALVASQPLHVIARVVRATGPLHGRAARHAIERALRRSLGRSAFRIVHLRISTTPGTRTHRVELVVEAADRIALARGMQGFQVAAAKHLNRLHGRRGPVFADRYRARPLRTLAAVRAVIGASPGTRASRRTNQAEPTRATGRSDSFPGSSSLDRWIAVAWPETTLLRCAPP
ncbi:MAG: hypothetical protein ABI467_33000 [Kofleriaceae bacterium]